MINIRKFVGIATVGATLLGFSSMASAQKIVWHGPIYRPVHIVYNPVRYAPVPIPRFGIYEPVAPVLVTTPGGAATSTSLAASIDAAAGDAYLRPGPSGPLCVRAMTQP